MKSIVKQVLWLTLGLLMVSCQNDLDNELDKNLDIVPQTKSRVSAPSVLPQLSGIPVNIRLKSGNRNYSYLSSSKKTNAVDLHSIDDGSLRQRWLISSKPSGLSIRVEGGAYVNGYLTAIGSLGSYVPKLMKNDLYTGIRMKEGEIESTFYIFSVSYLSPPTEAITEYLYSVDAVNRGLAFAEKEKTGGRYVWEIVPVEEFTLKDVSYFMDYGDRVDSSLVFLRTYNMDNRGNPNSGSHTATIHESYTSSSQFSEVTGLNMSEKISNSTSFKVGLPSIDIGGSVSFEHLTEKTWSYSTTQAEEKKFEWTDVFTTVVPANKLMTLSVYLQNYVFDISYVGTLVGNSTGRTIKLKGRWQGSFGSKIIYRPVINGVSLNNVERNVRQLKAIGEQ